MKIDFGDVNVCGSQPGAIEGHEVPDSCPHCGRCGVITPPSLSRSGGDNSGDFARVGEKRGRDEGASVHARNMGPIRLLGNIGEEGAGYEGTAGPAVAIAGQIGSGSAALKVEVGKGHPDGCGGGRVCRGGVALDKGQDRQLDKGQDQQLDPYQQQVFDACSKGDNVFISGIGGTGKTFLIKRWIPCPWLLSPCRHVTIHPTRMAPSPKLLASNGLEHAPHACARHKSAR